MNDDRCLFHKTLGARISLWGFWGLFLRFFRWGTAISAGGWAVGKDRFKALFKQRGLVADDGSQPKGE
jgi:hypothetical protein